MTRIILFSVYERSLLKANKHKNKYFFAGLCIISLVENLVALVKLFYGCAYVDISTTKVTVKYVSFFTQNDFTFLIHYDFFLNSAFKVWFIQDLNIILSGI